MLSVAIGCSMLLFAVHQSAARDMSSISDRRQRPRTASSIDWRTLRADSDDSRRYFDSLIMRVPPACYALHNESLPVGASSAPQQPEDAPRLTLLPKFVEYMRTLPRPRVLAIDEATCTGAAIAAPEREWEDTPTPVHVVAERALRQCAEERRTQSDEPCIVVLQEVTWQARLQRPVSCSSRVPHIGVYSIHCVTSGD